MTGKTHITGGILAGSIVLYELASTQIEATPLWDLCILAGSITGALAPDVDEVHSMAGRKIKIVSFPLAFTHAIFSILAFFLPRRSKIRYNITNISWATGHRGMMHWPSTIIVLCSTLFLFAQLLCRFCPSTVALFLLNGYILGFGIGMISLFPERLHYLPHSAMQELASHCFRAVVFSTHTLSVQSA